MPRKLKVYKTSIGFHDLAVAAPSMKAAAEAWGSDVDIFKRGFAGETDDPKVVKSTMAAPGIVLRRPVGSSGEFSEHSALPKGPERRPGAERPTRSEAAGKSGKKAEDKESRAAARENERAAARAREAAVSREREQTAREKEKAAAREKEEAAAREKERQRLERERQREEAERERARRERERKIARLKADFEKAEARHDAAVEALARRRVELAEDDARETERWEAEQRRHRQALKELE